jgi:hypothetical protein
MGNRGCVIGVVVAIVVYLLAGALVLGMQRESIQGSKGQIWNQIKTGGEKLGAIENQLKAAYKDRQDLVAKIVEGRKQYDAAMKSGDLNGATSAAQALGTTLKVMVENYPSTDLSGLQVGTLDETAGIFNRIGYARSKLIDTQVGYNQLRMVFFPLAAFYSREQVLGENFDPGSAAPTSSMGQ